MGSGFKVFQVGEVLGAADVNGYLMRQSIASLASGQDVVNTISAPEEGQIAYLRDADVYWFWDGSQWRVLNQGGNWFPYTPTWTSDGTQPSLGNGTITGRYKREGKTVSFKAMVSLGSTSTVGTGAYSLTLPPTAPPRISNPAQYVFSRVSDASSGQAYAGQSGAIEVNSANGTLFSAKLLTQGTANLDGVTPTKPVTLAVGDALHLFGEYEGAF